MIPYGCQDINQADIDAVVEVLRSDFLTQGPVVPRFEQLVATQVNCKHAIATTSATSALHTACLALELGLGDILWTVSNTFVASANCALYCGAQIDFVDIDELTWNISITKLKEKLIHAKKNDSLPKVLVPVHFAGQPSIQEELWELAQEFGFRVLEDAAHAIGASRNGEPVGSCRWSDITVFSFHPVKIITTGEGGMLLTNDENLARRMAQLRSHGITHDKAMFTQPSRGPWDYEQQMLGYNYRMTDMQAALGISQLERLDSFIERRTTLARQYDQALCELPIELPTVLPENRSAWHLYVIRVNTTIHRRVFEGLRQQGIGVNLHYMPVHLQPYYRALGFTKGQCPEAEAHGESAITLPLFPTLTDQNQDQVVNILSQEIANA